MIQCPKCSAQLPDESKFCLSCGEPLSSLSQAPTVAVPEGEAPLSPAISPRVGRIVSSDSVPARGFTPGTILADRYRIIGLLGRGGMGEVYRADDLKLGQPVALKFLPPALAQDSVRRERFFAEVRITRQLSHPNICRVYDIGEFEGRHFLSMEYIDGEDLASLMKRIGHLSNEKALDIARQLLAGLSVAHERGVLHRDLKPANIMLDGHGRVRITDFGLAIAVGDEPQTEEIAGTPAYMAPEQLAGKGATVRSDIYSLGLILYEIYTGKKAFKAKTLAELRAQKETQTPRAPSELREGIDPVVERVIQRCMEKDPNARPASVVQLAQALPGGDPLAAAIAAGETPSPEMVAASGPKEGLKPAIAWGLLAFIILGTIAMMAMNYRVMLHQRIPFNNSPDVLIKKCQEIIEKAGYSEKPADIVYGFVDNSDFLSFIEKTGNASNYPKTLNSKEILFWYRQSPLPFGTQGRGERDIIAADNPPLHYPGEIRVILDTEGYLVSFDCYPPKKQESFEAAQEPDWKLLLDATGMSELNKVRPQKNPPFYADVRVAWQGSYPDLPDIPIRIEAAALHGKPVSFEIIGIRKKKTDQTGRLGYPIFFIALAGGIYFARRNLRLGRGDRRNATRLAIFTLLFHSVCRAFGWHYSRTVLDPILVDISISFFMAGFVWIFYTAMEPFVRRRWPKVLVSWTRLISGDWKNPLIARDVLVGCFVGILMLVTNHLGKYIVPLWFGHSELSLPIAIDFRTVLGTRFFISAVMDFFGGPFLLTFLSICFFFLLQILLRNQRVAIIAFALIATFFINEAGYSWTLPVAIIISVLATFVLTRYGIVAFLTSTFTYSLLIQAPTNLRASAWYSEYSFATITIFVVIALYAFYTSLGGRPIFGTPRLDSDSD